MDDPRALQRPDMNELSRKADSTFTKDYQQSQQLDGLQLNPEPKEKSQDSILKGL